MKWKTTVPPKDKPILAKFNSINFNNISNEEYYYYVVQWNPFVDAYVEYLGEQYCKWNENLIIAWTTFEELTKDSE